MNLETKHVYDWLSRLDGSRIQENLKHFARNHLNPKKKRRKSQFTGSGEDVAWAIRHTVGDCRAGKAHTVLAQSNSRSERALAMCDMGRVVGHDVDNRPCRWVAVVVGEDRRKPGEACIFTSFPTTEEYALSRLPIGVHPNDPTSKIAERLRAARY